VPAFRQALARGCMPIVTSARSRNWRLAFHSTSLIGCPDHHPSLVLQRRCSTPDASLRSWNAALSLYFRRHARAARINTTSYLKKAGTLKQCIIGLGWVPVGDV
jgi:hypothetical protein